ncbi:hypothetical protein R0K17_05915 [Planococcus sp. SIMBA_143]
MAYKIETISTDLEIEFDKAVNEFVSNHDVIDMAFCTTVAPYNDGLHPYFVVHITYTDHKEK